MLSGIGGVIVYCVKFLFTLKQSVDTVSAQNKSIIIELDEMWEDIKHVKANLTKQEMVSIETRTNLKQAIARNRELSKDFNELEQRFYDKMLRAEKIIESFGKVIVKD